MFRFSFFNGTFLRQGVEQHHGLLASLAAYMCPGALCTRMSIFIFFLFLIRYEMAKGAKCQETVCFPFLLCLLLKEVERVKKRGAV